MASVFPKSLLANAAAIVANFSGRGRTLALAESCTGGLLAGLFTEIPGSSAVLGFGFVSYSNTAKTDLLGVPPELFPVHGAVSSQVAAAMVGGAIARSGADVALAITGIAGPGGGTPAKPVGLVFLAAQCRDQVAPVVLERRYGDLGRSLVRLRAVEDALALIRTVGVVSI